MTDALVLAGGVAKGAFGAGALSVLSEPAVKARLGLDVRRIAAASSGALSGAFYAAAIRAGQEAGAGARLARLWLDDANSLHAFHISARDIVRGRGLSTEDSFVSMMRRHIRPSDQRNPIELRLVVSNADGDVVRLGDEPITTFEHVADFAGADFDAVESLERMYGMVAASLALPGVYAPVPLEIDGRTVRGLDGGLTCNTPLGHALEGADGVTRVFVIVPFPRVQEEPANLRGLKLVNHVFDMLVLERLYRDLRAVERANRALDDLDAVALAPEQRAAVLAALGWSARRRVQVVEIRPPSTLPGTGFSGVWSRELRAIYLDAGAEAARSVVARLA